mmetsp:Transcript_18435/g.52656  ORF Transcript_18435/g.52656 Transcript_18435/m.52656 type:complete len:215 (+) Transcript_18435:606-1250(+)
MYHTAQRLEFLQGGMHNERILLQRLVLNLLLNRKREDGNELAAVQSLVVLHQRGVVVSVRGRHRVFDSCIDTTPLREPHGRGNGFRQLEAERYPVDALRDDGPASLVACDKMGRIEFGDPPQEDVLVAERVAGRAQDGVLLAVHRNDDVGWRDALAMRHLQQDRARQLLSGRRRIDLETVARGALALIFQVDVEGGVISHGERLSYVCACGGDV